MREKDYFLLDIKTRRKSFEEIFCKKVTMKDLSVLCSELSTMISSGIPISQSLDIIEDLNSKKQIRKSLCEIRKSVIQGKTIYVSMKKFKYIYPRFMIEMIRIGEESGKIDEVLKKLSAYYEKQHEILIKVKTALIYPIIVFITSIFIVIFLMMKIIPQFIDILKCSGGEIPFLTQLTISLYTILKTKFFVISITLFSLIFLVYRYSKTSIGKAYFDGLKTKLPLFKRLYNKFIMSKFSISMGILMTSGFTVLKALEITRSILVNKVVEDKIVHSIEDIKNGKSIYYSFKKQDIGDNMFLALVKTGEETGRLDNMLLKSAEIFEKDIEESLKKMVAFIEPLTILFLAFFIGTFVVAALMPVFNIMDSIG